MAGFLFEAFIFGPEDFATWSRHSAGFYRPFVHRVPGWGGNSMSVELKRKPLKVNKLNYEEGRARD